MSRSSCCSCWALMSSTVKGHIPPLADVQVCKYDPGIQEADRGMGQAVLYQVMCIFSCRHAPGLRVCLPLPTSRWSCLIFAVSNPVTGSTTSRSWGQLQTMVLGTSAASTSTGTGGHRFPRRRILGVCASENPMPRFALQKGCNQRDREAAAQVPGAVNLPTASHTNPRAPTISTLPERNAG